MSQRLEKVYGRLPTPLQHVAVTAYGYAWRRRRLGGRFADIRADFAARSELTAAEWSAWQTWRLREMLALAWQSPHHRARWEALGLLAGDLSNIALSDLPQLPTLTKDEVRRAPEALCPGGRPARGDVEWHTSGSTGTPLVTYYSSDDFRRGMAVRDARYAAHAGVDYSLPRATFSGRRIEPDPDSAGPFHRYNAAEKQVYFSPYHLGPSTVARYVDALWRHRPAWLTGYASAIGDLARLALAAGLECPPLRAVITAAEPVPDGLREAVRAAFGCRVFEEYGLIEEVGHALECEHGSLHVSPDAAVVEILDERGAPCPPGVVGEIVGTSLIREAQPFVRYRTGDLASWSERPCPCRRETPILESVIGRLDDVVLGADGRRVGRLSTVPKGLPGVVATQFRQHRPGAVEVHVVCDDELPAWVAEELRRRLRDRLGSGTDVTVARVASLPRTARGKVRGVVSTIAADAH